VAGVDMDMESSLYLGELPGLIKAGKVQTALVDDAVRRVLRLKVALGLFEHPYVDEAAQPRALDRALAKQAAVESFVLLQNRGALPIADTVHKLAVIGPLADDAPNMLGGWAAVPDPKPVTTLRAALAKDARFAVSYERGVDLVGG